MKASASFTQNPYDFVPAGRYKGSYGDIGNGNERGISTSRTGRSWVLYRNIDFGPDGSDTVELPIFSLDGEPTAIRFWDGEPLCDRQHDDRRAHLPQNPRCGTSTSPIPSVWTSA